MASFFSGESDWTVHRAGLFIDGKFAPCPVGTFRTCDPRRPKSAIEFGAEVPRTSRDFAF
jgi:hypothetical protein